jgi:hypothetical protein
MEMKLTLKYHFILAAAALAALTLPAAAGNMTCRGEYFVNDQSIPHMRIIGSPEKRLCYLPDGDTEASAIVDAACKAGETCVVRAEVDRRDTQASRYAPDLQRVESVLGSFAVERKRQCAS